MTDPLGFGRAGFRSSSGGVLQSGRLISWAACSIERVLMTVDPMREHLRATSGNPRKGLEGKIKEGFWRLRFPYPVSGLASAGQLIDDLD